jgi:microcystin-dependent protein
MNSYKNISYLLFGVVLSMGAGLWMSASQPTKEANPESAEGMIGEVQLFAGNFAPRGWAFCTGQMLPINTNQALFSILGTTYGGDGRTTFALPDLRAKVPVHPGTSNGLPNFQLGRSVNVTANRALPGGEQALSHGLLGMNYIICVQGVFPSRN